MSEQRKVAIVTDSTSDIPVVLKSQYNIDVVPLTVSFGSASYQDGVDLTPPQFFDRLRATIDLPKTSQPSTSSFETAYNQAIEAEYDVLCITLSSDLSGTFNAARLAAESIAPDRIQVLDSRSTTMELGWIVIEAARAAGSGADLEACAARATAAMGRTRMWAVLQTLDYVYRGGRIGRASHVFGSALAIKPVLAFKDGVLTPVERVRTWKRALNRATELAASTGSPTDIAVLHTDNLKDAEATADKLRKSFPEANIIIDWCGATMATYAGPGAIGIMTFSDESGLPQC